MEVKAPDTRLRIYLDDGVEEHDIHGDEGSIERGGVSFRYWRVGDFLNLVNAKNKADYQRASEALALLKGMHPYAQKIAEPAIRELTDFVEFMGAAAKVASVHLDGPPLWCAIFGSNASWRSQS
jgi:hypothetical protein